MAHLQRDAIKRILIIKTSALGDIVRTFPSIVYVRKSFPAARISMLVGEPYMEIIEPCPHVDEIIPYKKRRNTEDLAGFIKFGLQMRARKFDLVLNLQNTRRFDYLARLCKPRVRSSMVHFDHPVDGVEGVFEILRTVGLEPQRRYYEFWFAPDDNLFAAHFQMENELLSHHRVVGINPGGMWETKQYPIKSYAALIDKIAAAVKDARFIVFGGPDEVERGMELASLASHPVIVASGKTTIRQAARLIKDCSVFVSNDSGLMHIAAMLETPTVGIFGPTNPREHGPVGEGHAVVYRGVECSPCYSPECTLDFEQLFCLNSIPLDEVFRSVKKIMR